MKIKRIKIPLIPKYKTEHEALEDYYKYHGYLIPNGRIKGGKNDK